MFDMGKFTEGIKAAGDVSDGKSLDDVFLFRKVLEWKDCSQADSLGIEDYARLLENIGPLAGQACQFYDISKRVERTLQSVKRIPQRRLL